MYFDSGVYKTTAYKYCKRIADGKVPSNKWMILFAKKFINDIERSKDDDYPYFFDMQKAQFIEEFIYQLRYTEGLKVGKNIKLADFQANIVQNSFCWRLKEDKSIYRYREIIVYLPRKQGKSYICSILGLIAMMLEPNAEVVNGAGKLSQAQILVNMAIKLVRSNPELAEHFKIYKKYLEFQGSTFKAVSSNAESMDGMNISNCIIDESKIVDRALRDSLTSGFLMRKNYQTYMISTEYDVNSEDNWFEEMLTYGKKVLESTVEDERILPILYMLDSSDEIHDKNQWIKACPILEEVPATSIENEYKKALENPAIMKNLLIKQFNVPQRASNKEGYMDMEKWKVCEVDKVDFTDKEITVSVDMSISTDLSAINMMYYEDGIYYTKSIGFLPEESLVGRRERFDYRLSEQLGECHILDGAVIDYNYIEDYIRNIPKKFKCKIKSICFDAYNSNQMMMNLAQDFDVIDIKQNYFNLNTPTKEFRNEVYLKKVRYEKSKLYTWCMSNAITRTDAQENMMLDKKKSQNRIDLAVATIFGFKNVYTPEETKKFNIDDIFII